MKSLVALALAIALAAAAGPQPVKIDRQSKLLDFTFEWPAEAAAIPALDKRFRTEADKAYAEAHKDAEEDMALTREQTRDYHQHYYAAGWETLGQSQRLLSLVETVETFTGGAHPNHESSALVWDRRSDKEIAMDDLFAKLGAFTDSTRSAYCAALDKERSIRREGEKLGGEFDECPKFADLAIAPADKNRDGRFDTIDFIAPPYVAGPYAEGEYDVELPVTAKLIAAMKAEYGPSFEVQRGQ
jgi:hypothetical protein